MKNGIDRVVDRAARPADGGGGLLPGSPVEVRTRFDGRWVSGFRVVAVEAGRFRIARSRDGSTLPEFFGTAEVRPIGVAHPVPWPATA